MTNLITGIVGIAMVVTFLGFLAWWLKELPFTIIVIAVVIMLLYDFVRSLRGGNDRAGR